MPFDGCFLHYLTLELKETLLDAKVNRIYQPSPLEVVLNLRTKVSKNVAERKNVQLVLSSRLDFPHINISQKKYQNPENPLHFCMILRKYLERSELTSIVQHGSDRIIELHFSTYNELDDYVSYLLILEITGRNSNLILTDSNYQIIDAMRKLPPSLESARTILPHAKYQYLTSNKLNPFDENVSLDNLDNLEGISKALRNQLTLLSVKERATFLNQQINPVIFQGAKVRDFYAFPLSKDDKILASFSSLSDLLDNYETGKVVETNYQAALMEKEIQKIKKKNLHKLENLNQDLEKALENLKYNDLGILLQANLYQVKKGMSSISVNNFLTDNSLISIELNKNLDPSTNLKKIFQIAKKAKNGCVLIEKQIKLVEEEIDYLDTILFQISQADNSDAEEIRTELSNLGYLKSTVKTRNKKQVIKNTSYALEDIFLYVGKNNIQNEYLTTKFASSNDYWFHVKDMPGSHVIVHVPQNNPDYELSEVIIRTAAHLAAIYSKGTSSSSVPVDYTKIRYIKKIPGMKGYHVTYTNQKTIYIDPDKSIVLENLGRTEL